MPTHKERILAVMRGEMVDKIPFVPRLDLWWLSNSTRRTMPKEFDGMMPDDIAKSQGWACYHDATQFFYEYRDHQKEMFELAESLEVYFNKVLAVIEESPAEVVFWGANYDDMLTYPPYFEKEIIPWLRKIPETLGTKGKIVATHTDGENYGLMDLIRDSGAHVAESVTLWPMTKVRIEEYYERWREKLTIMGGIPESILLEDTTTDEFVRQVKEYKPHILGISALLTTTMPEMKNIILALEDERGQGHG